MTEHCVAALAHPDVGGTDNPEQGDEQAQAETEHCVAAMAHHDVGGADNHELVEKKICSDTVPMGLCRIAQMVPNTLSRPARMGPYTMHKLVRLRVMNSSQHVGSISLKPAEVKDIRHLERLVRDHATSFTTAKFTIGNNCMTQYEPRMEYMLDKTLMEKVEKHRVVHASRAEAHSMEPRGG